MDLKKRGGSSRQMHGCMHEQSWFDRPSLFSADKLGHSFYPTLYILILNVCQKFFCVRKGGKKKEKKKKMVVPNY